MEHELKKVVQRIYVIAKEFYENDIRTHIQSIYNRLTDGEQVTLLKGLVPYLFEIEKPPRPATAAVDENMVELSIETYNQIELIKLKTWIIKCMAIVVSMFLGIATIYAMVNSFIPTGDTGMFSEIASFLKTLLGL